MIQVLQPLKVTHCDTASVNENIGEEFDSLVKENLLCCLGCGTVSGFNDKPTVESVSIAFVDRFFKGCRNEDITK